MADAQSPASHTDMTAEIRRLLDQTLALHQAGRLAEAEAGYRRVLALDPRDPNALTNLATLAAKIRPVKSGPIAVGASAPSMMQRSIAC